MTPTAHPLSTPEVTVHDPQDESAARVYVFHGTDSTQVLSLIHI